MRTLCPHPRRLLMAITLLLPLVCGCFASAEQGRAARIRADRNRASRQALIDLEAAYVRAFNARDARLLDRLIAEDYLLTGPDGVTIGKADLIRYIQSLPDGVTAATTVYEVRTYGDCGIVVANFVMSQDGRRLDFERFTETCLRRGGRWYFLALHSSQGPAE